MAGSSAAQRKISSRFVDIFWLSKEGLPHGSFLPWIEAEFGMSLRTAYRFMEVTKAYGGKFGFDGPLCTCGSEDAD